MNIERNIRQIGPESAQEYVDIYLNAYPAFKTLDDECRKHYLEKTLFDMRNDKEVDFFGMFEGDKLISLMKLVNFRINLFGKMTNAVGLMSLAVHPLFKKQGVALRMIQFYESYAKNKGADVAILLPFNMKFYRKMGYGLGAKMDEYHLTTEQLPKYKDMSCLRMLGKDDLSDILKCHERFAQSNHGMLMKFEEEIRSMQQEAQVRVGCYESGTLTGYAAYHFEEASNTNYTLNRIVVDELIYRDGKILRNLLGFLRNQADLAQTIVIRSGEEDFYHIFDDASDISGNYIPFGYLQVCTSAVGNMYKILDPKKFVTNTSYRKFPDINLTARFCYYDEMSDENNELTIIFRNGKWSVGDASPDISVTCRKSDLSSLLMNCGRLASFIRVGVMETEEEEYAETLDQLLYFSQKPFSNSDF